MVVVASQLAVTRGAFVLGPVSFALGAGEALLVTGPSLGGKTSLLKALVGLVPSAGTVTVGGLALDARAPARLSALRAQVGMVFQNDALFDALDALENAALPLLRRGTPRPAALARAREALAQVGLADAAAKRPEQLSGGMRKRLGLARAIAAPTALLLVDDPLAGLDPGASGRIVALLQALRAEGRALVVAAADPRPLWALAQHGLWLESGRASAEGPLDAVRARWEAA
jgi:ABC-type transporter Mla maintaining outer membrane lipid asymmetry ATPase subunit MlaF